MEIKLLGTGAAEGVPAMFCNCDFCKRAMTAGGKNFRARNNAMINRHILIDFSPDMHSNLIRYRVNFAEITDLFISHPHVDHIAAAELVLRSEAHYCFGLGGRRMRVHCSPECEALIRGLVRYDQQTTEGDDFLEFHPLVPFVPIEAGDVTITPLPSNHAREGFPCYVFLAEQDGKQFLYGTDASSFPESTWDFLLKQHIHAAILDCTYGVTPVAETTTHMNLERDIATWERLKAGNALAEGARCWLTHFSHKCGALHDEIAAAAAPHGLEVGWDGLEILI